MSMNLGNILVKMYTVESFVEARVLQIGQES